MTVEMYIHALSLSFLRARKRHLNGTSIYAPLNPDGRSPACSPLLKLIFITIAPLWLWACASPPVIERTPELSGNYVLDPAHARVNWSLSHAGLSHYTARFDTVSGVLDFDPLSPEKSRADIRIAARSVSTGLPKFDETLSTDTKYFDSETYPEIRFVTTSIIVTSATTGTLTGDLTLRGVTKPLTLTTVFNGAGKSFGHPGKTLGFSAKGELIRSDFGMDYLTNFGIGDRVTLHIEAEFNTAKN